MPAAGRVRPGTFGELDSTGARSVLRRYSDAWFTAAKRRRAGDSSARYPRRRRGLVPVRWYAGTFTLDGRVLRIPVARGCTPLLVRLDLPAGPDPARVAGVDLGIIHPYAVAGPGGQQLLVSGRAIRAECRQHLRDRNHPPTVPWPAPARPRRESPARGVARPPARSPQAASPGELTDRCTSVR